MTTENVERSAKRFLPPIGSQKYYVLLGVIAIFILGPLDGISAAYMNFSLGSDLGKSLLWEPQPPQVCFPHPPSIQSGVSPVPRQPPHSKRWRVDEHASKGRQGMECGG